MHTKIRFFAMMIVLFATSQVWAKSLIGYTQEKICLFSNKVFGVPAKSLLSASYQEPLQDDDRISILQEACAAFGVDSKKIDLQWSADIIPYSHFLWGNVLFLNKSIWEEASNNKKTWMIWHEVAHYARNHYGLNQILFATGAAAITYVLSNFGVVGTFMHASGGNIWSGEIALTIPVLIGTFYNYRTMLRCQEISAMRRAAEALCNQRQRAVVEEVYEETMIYLLRSSSDRAAWCFPTWKEQVAYLQDVLAKDDLRIRFERVLHYPDKQ